MAIRRPSLRNNHKKVNYAPDLDVLKIRGFDKFLQNITENRRGLRYQNISDEIKQKFIEEVLKRSGTIKSAAEKYDINFSTAKAILHVYRKEGRVGKKLKRHHRNSCFAKIKKKSKKQESFINMNGKNNSQKVQKDIHDAIPKPDLPNSKF